MSWKRSLIISLCVSYGVLLSLSGGVNEAYGSPGNLAVTRSPEFSESPKIRPRVGFWIDIFTRHGEHSMVFHHRDYPQVVFGAFDYSREAKEMSPRRLEGFKKLQKKRHLAAIKGAVERLAKGNAPHTVLEKSIENQMRSIPGGAAKYKKILNDDLVRVQTGIKEKFEQAIIRSGRYMPTIEKIFNEHDLPVELTRLPFVESSFDYKAYSSVGAAGIWQFMPRTAKLFKLKISSSIDERRDPVESTKAAARYLLQAYKELGSWPLALTSYNHGIYGVKKAVRTMGTTDLVRIVEHHGKRPFGFASNNFYAEFLAALEVYEHYRDYFPGVVPEEPIEFDVVPLANSYSIDHITKQLNLSRDDLLPLNYALSKSAYAGRVLITQGYALKVPKGHGMKANRLRLAEPAMVAPEATASSIYGGATHRVRPNETLSEIARQYKTTVQKLMALNNLSSTQIRQGQYLTVKKKVVEPPTQGSIYVVRRGDTLGRIAAKFKVSLTSLMKHNGFKNYKIKPGQKVRIPNRNQNSSVAASRKDNEPTRTFHKVRSGDSLWRISKRYGVSIAELKAANHGKTRLRPGDIIIVPN